MATQPLRTSTSKQIMEWLDEMRHEADLQTDGEMDTYSRMIWRVKRDTYDLVRTAVRSLLPYVETDAVQKVIANIGLTDAERLLDGTPDVQDDPTDPSLPFARVSV